jgi:crotonobetainyl-CoA:carnitine CoA-transferase CaiB-like acyl-CoA transferase
MPMGLAVADMLAGNALAQGILAALAGRGIHGRGARIDTSLLEATLDFQFEVLTTHLNDGRRLPERSAVNGAHAYLGAPYGVYRTADSYLAIAMTPSLKMLAELMGIDGLAPYYDDAAALMRHRDEIKTIMAAAIAGRTTADWLAVLQPADIWCSEVMDWPAVLDSEAYRLLDFEQVISRDASVELNALRSPIRIDGQVLRSRRGAPALGADQDTVFNELLADTMPAGSSATMTPGCVQSHVSGK